MPKQIPTIGDPNWGIPLNNHLSQLQNPINGGINTFEQFSQRPTNLTADDAGKTYLYTQTGNIHQWTGTTWKVLNESVINVKDYGAVGDYNVTANTGTDDSPAIQFCIDNFDVVFIPKGKFLLNNSLKVISDKKIYGSSMKDTYLYRVPVTKTDHGTATSIGGIVDSYNVNAVFTMVSPSALWNLGSEISDMTINSTNTTAVDFGFYAPRIGKFTIKNIYMNYINYGFRSHDSFLGNFQKVEQLYGKTLFGIVKDASGGAGGTSMNVSDCSTGGAEIIQDSLGYDIFGLTYSCFTHCTVDGHQMAFKFNTCRGLTLNGCGTELIQPSNGTTSGIAIEIQTCKMVINGFRSIGVAGGNYASETYYLLIGYDSQVVMNSCWFGNLGTSNALINYGNDVANKTRDYQIYANSQVICNATLLPVGGIYGGIVLDTSSLQINDGFDIKRVTSAGTKSVTFA
jgi:hypothetical protein